MESAAGGAGCAAAAPDLCRFGVPAGSAERADGGAGQAGRPDAGAVPELQAAGRDRVHGPRRGCRAKDLTPQEKEPGRATCTKSRRGGHDDADDILHGPCESPKCLNMGSFVR